MVSEIGANMDEYDALMTPASFKVSSTGVTNGDEYRCNLRNERIEAEELVHAGSRRTKMTRRHAASL